MRIKQPWKSILGTICLGIYLAAASVWVYGALHADAPGPKSVPAGSWLADFLWDALSLRTEAAAAICALLVFGGVIFLSRTAVRRLADSRDWTPALLLCGIGGAVLLPARSLFTDYAGALLFALPCALALFATGLLLLAYREGPQYPAYAGCLLLYSAACGGSVYVAIGVTAFLAAGNVLAALRRKSIVKTNLALALVFSGATLNLFL